jgi:hydroxyacylglutathione hydrolase
MILKRLYDDSLAQASYLLGCPASGEALVIDPNRDVAQYVEAAAAEGLRIVAVTETHIHADYLSGSRELARSTGARLYLSDEGGDDWKYAFASDEEAVLLRDGDHFEVGGFRIDVLKTPGHTPEHISLILTEEAASSEPLGVFTGDFVFVGDVGRPDLLETAAGFAGTMEASARTLFRSLSQIKTLPPHLLLWPAHGAGSACGKSLGGVPVSSLGYELKANWGLQAVDEESFVREVLSGQPEPPKYFAEMKRLNKEGPPLLGGLRIPPRRQDAHRLADAPATQTVVIDVRPTSVVAKGFLPGALHIPFGKSFPTWAGWLVPYRTDILLIAESAAEAVAAVRSLTLIGLDDVVGWYGPDVMDRLESLGRLEEMAQSSAESLCEPSGEVTVLDVRSAREWSEGHVPGAIHVPLGMLPDRADEIPLDRQIAVHCESGYRSPIAYTVLRSLGFGRITNVEDGYEGYCRSTSAGSAPAAV